MLPTTLSWDMYTRMIVLVIYKDSVCPALYDHHILTKLANRRRPSTRFRLALLLILPRESWTSDRPRPL
jgi:hypothetical protein